MKPNPLAPRPEEGAASRVGSAPAGDLDVATLHAAVQELLSVLPERPRRIVEERFGIGTGEPKTLMEIGEERGVSRERIRQIVAGALRTFQEGTPADLPVVGRVWNELASLLTFFGRVVTWEILVRAVGGNTAKDRAALQLLLASFPAFAEARETQRTYAHWTFAASSPRNSASSEVPALEAVLETGERLLERSGHVIPEERFFAEIRSTLGSAVSDVVLRSFLSASKSLVRNPFGDVGLRRWREASPRSVGDKAYLVLKARGKPLHFRAVADEINRTGFDARRALAETVHNDLIRDSRFVLVGRGMYALKEWGFTPGKVADVVARVLQRAGRPLPKSEILPAVLKERFVKRNTVLLSLLDRSRFRALPDGTYVLAGAAPAPPSPPTLRPGRGAPGLLVDPERLKGPSTDP